MRTKPTFISLLLLLFFLLNIFVVAANFIDPVYGHELLEEDRLVENFTALFLLFAAFYVLIMVVSHKNQQWLPKIMQILLVLALIFMAGEEISWGQRIFGWQTTGIFKADNLQGETNFHNLKVDGVKLNKWVFTWGLGAIGGFAFLIAPYLYRISAGFSKFVNKFGATIPQYKQTLLLVISYAFVFIIPSHPELFPSNRSSELWECNVAFVIFWMVYDPINRSEIYRNTIKP
jgi:hypothetical protein